MRNPGSVWSQDFPYDTRFPWGVPGDFKIVSYPASEDIYPGTLVQIVPGTETLRSARDANGIVGVAVYDPRYHSASVVYNRYDVVPVMRRGSVFVAFLTQAPPFRDPRPLETARFYAPTGIFTTDATGTLTNPKIVFSAASRDYYPNSDGSPQADVPFPVPPPSPDTGRTTFGEGVALVEINL